MNSAKKLFKKIGYPEQEVVLSIEEFFEKNESIGSIGPNIFPDPPSPSDFYKILKEIKRMDTTQDVLIRICDIDDEEWPFSETIYILSSLSADYIEEIVKKLRPDEVSTGWLNQKPINAPELETNIKVISLWWD